jgi:hypothetical protein
MTYTVDRLRPSGSVSAIQHDRNRGGNGIPCN